jgi:hypothetical protein
MDMALSPSNYSNGLSLDASCWQTVLHSWFDLCDVQTVLQTCSSSCCMKCTPVDSNDYKLISDHAISKVLHLQCTHSANVFTGHQHMPCVLFDQARRAHAVLLTLTVWSVPVPCALPAVLLPLLLLLLLLLLQRVLFDPNKGDLDKVNDYFANVYFGEVDIAEADPVIAAAGGVVSEWKTAAAAVKAAHSKICCGCLMHSIASLPAGCSC